MKELHKTYLPFSADDLKKHFILSKNEHLDKFKKSIENYTLFENKEIVYQNEIKWIRQIEKDETFWTASSLMTIYHNKNQKDQFKQLFIREFGENPPFEDFENWDECLNGELELFFEPKISSPKEYRNWLRENVNKQTFIPYILEKAQNSNGTTRKDLEGPTNVDALLINIENGFSVIFEAKVLSDISYQVSYDTMRNQIARNIDIMLSKNEKIEHPLNVRDPNKTLFILLTPKLFKDNPRSRLYGYTFNEYKNNLNSLKEDLIHRNLDEKSCENITKRLGWLTWEDLKEVNNDCCKWIDTTNKH